MTEEQLVEACALALDDVLEAPASYATTRKIIAALAPIIEARLAARQSEVVAWLYEKPGHGPVASAHPLQNPLEGWTETPLYASPAQTALVEALRSCYTAGWQHAKAGNGSFRDATVDRAVAALRGREGGE